MLEEGLERVDWPPASSALEGDEPPDTESKTGEDKSSSIAAPIAVDDDSHPEPEGEDLED